MLPHWPTGGRLLSDRTGNVLPLAAIGTLVLAALVGAGVDMSRAYKVHNRLQSACDAAALAGRKAITTDGFDSLAQEEADRYFAANFDETAQEATGTVFEATSDDDGNTVTGTAATTLHTAVMQIFGYDKFDVEVTCSASMGVGNSDVIMVLDTTGSMDFNLSGTHQTRIQALRSAMKNFYDTLAGASSGTNARLRYGFVPYSSSVNVGRLIYDLDPAYLVDRHAYQSRQAIYIDWAAPSYVNSSNGSWSGWSSWQRGSCPGNSSWQNHGNPSNSTWGDTVTQTQQQRRASYDCQTSGNYVRYRYRYEYRDVRTVGTYTTTPTDTFDRWDYKQVNYDVSTYKTFSSTSTLTGSDWWGRPQWESSRWAGCIEERATVAASSFTYSAALGISPSGALDLDIDSAPDTADNATKWAPMWPEVSYLRTDHRGNYTTATTTYGRRAQSFCPQPAQLLQEMDEASFDAYADSLRAEGGTYLDLGMIWGGRLSSPDGMFQANVNEDPENGAEVSRHIIFMTDGELAPNNDIQTSYGIEYYDRRITSNGSSNQAARHSSRFRAICQAIKAKGIRIWVIAFATGLASDLTTCASDDSSYTANDADELDEAFQEIAKQVGELRIIQ